MTNVITDELRFVPARARAGSAVHFEDFVSAQQGALQNFAFLIIGHREDARDAVQDALVGALRHWDRAQRDPGAYVRRSIINAHISTRRKRRREILTDAVAGSVADASASNTLWVRSMCRTLPRKQSAAVVLRYFEDRTFAEIGTTLGCSEATARSLVSRAIAALRSDELGAPSGLGREVTPLPGRGALTAPDANPNQSGGTGIQEGTR